VTDLCGCEHDRASHEGTALSPQCAVLVDDGRPCGCLGFVAAGERVPFGGSNEDGVLCGCKRRVPEHFVFCPWCGRRIDDAPVQLVAYLESLVEQNERSAATRESTPDRYDGERRKRTADRLRARAAQQRAWIAWVRAHMEAP